MSARTERPVSVPGAVLSIVVLAIVAVLVRLAQLIDRDFSTPMACRGCHRTGQHIDPTGSLCDDCTGAAT